MAKHYNFGMVIGKVVKAVHNKAASGKVYLKLKITCDTPKYGQITTFGSIWGEKPVKKFMYLYKENPKRILKLKGILSQYQKDDTNLSNHIFLSSYALYDEQEQRATFVLRGKVVDVKPGNPYGTIYLQLNREDYQPESFEVYAPMQVVNDVPAGTIDVKGVLIPLESYYGDSKFIKPFVLEWKEVKSAKEAK